MTIPMWLDMSMHRVESITLSRGEAIDGSINWTDVVFKMQDRHELMVHCHGIDHAEVRIIDQTKEKPLLTPDELQDIEDARGPVAALSCETATLRKERVQP